MDWLQGIQTAVDYIEAHLAEKISYEEIAKHAYSSTYHFQRVFGMFCGCTLGEYIRRRKLTLAGSELAAGKAKVIEIALKYGYETPESFSRAFFRFHGILPSKVKAKKGNGCSLKKFPRLSLTQNFESGDGLKYRIEEKPEIILVGYKKRFSGMPYGEERAAQEEAFITSTRAKQWLLLGASSDYTTDYIVIGNVNDEGYDCYAAYELDEQTRKELFNPNTTGVDFMDKMGFETLVIPGRTYAIFETEKKKRPVADYAGIRKKIVGERVLTSEYIFSDAPEVIAMHWRPKGEWAKERYIEIRLPVEKRKAEK